MPRSELENSRLGIGAKTEEELTKRSKFSQKQIAFILRPAEESTSLEQALAPTLKPGNVIVLDNLRSHKGKAVRRAIPLRGRTPAVPARVQPQPHPDQSTLFKAQALAQTETGEIERNALNGDRNRIGKAHTNGMHKPHPECSLRLHHIGDCSKAAPDKI